MEPPKEQSSEKPSRRKRYPGKNPRRFADKYKEHQPERFPQDAAKIVSRGQTLAGSHRPIMVAEILELLAVAPGNTVVDCTLGYGGHAEALLAAIQPGGRLIGVDLDARELLRTEARLSQLCTDPDSLVLRRMNFAGVAQLIASVQPEGVDAIVADLGLSSMQLDDPARGFGYKTDGPLDMRMNQGRGLSAAELLSTLGVDQLKSILEENADEPNSQTIARAILKTHGRTPMTSTFMLADAVRQCCKHLATDEANQTIRRVFQAIRIRVNDEFVSLENFLGQLPRCLKAGGRVAILSFHSGEDRRVKAAFKAGFHQGLYSSIAQEIVRPSAAEQGKNPRSSSAKLRYAVRA